MEQLSMIREARTLGNTLDAIDLARPEGSEPIPRPSTVLFGPEKITAMNRQAEQLLADGKHNEALNVKYSVLSATGWFYGHRSRETGEVFMDLARFCIEMHRVQDAVRYASEGFQLLQQHLDHSDPEFGLALMNLSGVQNAAGQRDEALTSIQDALRILIAGLKQPHTVVGFAYGQLSLILESTGDFPAADKASRKAIDVLAAVHGAGHPIVARAFANHALLLAKSQKRAEAIVTAQRAFDLYHQTYGNDHWETRWARGVLETVSQS
jgi:tetratricopeptide (TPR) repeat protein